jgi:exopolysaccharide biosynthesis polyprenyl glycosylphosphotransferase
MPEISISLDTLASSPLRCLLVGHQDHLPRLTRYVRQRCGSPTGTRIVGFVDCSGRERQLILHPPADHVPTLGTIESIGELVSEAQATDVIIATSGETHGALRRQLEQLSTPRSGSIRVHWVRESDVAEIPVKESAGAIAWSAARPGSHGLRMLKRAIDLAGASLGLIVLGPLLLVVALAILLTSGRPILYCQERVGLRGRIFRMYKFRSMRVDAESSTGPIWAQDHDERCTRIGEFLRRTNIDELPQLFNVVRGEMSLVGPRPERPVFVSKFEAEMPRYHERLCVPGGMTGWAQVHGWRGRTSLEKRLEADLEYIRRWSPALDLRILVMTIEHVFRGRIRWDSSDRPA